MHRMKNFSFCGKIMSPKIPIWVSYDPFTLKKHAGCSWVQGRISCWKKKKDLHRLAEALQITGTLKCYQGTVFLVWYWNNSREILACNNNNNGNNFISVFPRSYMVLPTIHFEYITKARKKIDQQFTWKVKCAQWPPKELTVSFRIGDVDIKLQLTYRRRKKIWKRKTWSRTYDFIQKTIEMVIGSVGRDRSCYKIALLIRREWFPRLKIQQKRKWKLCD